MEKESDRTKTKLALLRSQTKRHNDKTWAARLSLSNSRAQQQSHIHLSSKKQHLTHIEDVTHRNLHHQPDSTPNGSAQQPSEKCS